MKIINKNYNLNCNTGTMFFLVNRLVSVYILEIYEFLFVLCKLLVYNVLFNIKHNPFLKVKWSLREY